SQKRPARFRLHRALSLNLPVDLIDGDHHVQLRVIDIILSTLAILLKLPALLAALHEFRVFGFHVTTGGAISILIQENAETSIFTGRAVAVEGSHALPPFLRKS